MSRAHVRIDATHPSCELRLFGMTLVERILRGLMEAAKAANVVLGQITVELPEQTQITRLLPRGLVERLPLRWSHNAAPLIARLEEAREQASGDLLLVVQGNAVVDTRLLQHILGAAGNVAFVGGEGPERTALLKLDAPLREFDPASDDLLSVCEEAIASGQAKELVEAHYDGYVSRLRRQLPFYLLRVSDKDSLRRTARFLFWSNYKGSTDFMTKYVYPPLVWQILRPLARLRVHPNWVTGVSIVCTLAALPLFATGQWGLGLALAYTMSVLDSVDGKLARLTYRDSPIGNVLDHGLDLVHPPLWYMAWAWALSSGEPGSWLFLSSIVLLGWYVFDRLITLVCTMRTGRSIHGIEELDVKMRTFISRRNVNLPLFTIALLFGVAVPCFYAIVLWQIASALFHTQRLIKFWGWRPEAVHAH